MAQFIEVLPALEAGASIRRTIWESITKVFVSGGQMVQQRGDGAPYAYSLDWYEIAADDWSVIEAAPVV